MNPCGFPAVPAAQHFWDTPNQARSLDHADVHQLLSSPYLICLGKHPMDVLLAVGVDFEEPWS